MTLNEIKLRFFDLFSTVEYEEDGGIQISKLDSLGDELAFELKIHTGINNDVQLCRAVVKGVREELIKLDWVDEIAIFDEHPLLWRYNNVHSELYFSRPSNKPFELFNDIFESHERVTKSWYTLKEFINRSSQVSLIQLCKSQNALFAKGPQKILKEYAKVLELHNMRPNLLGEYPPKRWKQKYWVDETEPLSVLVIGKSFVIAEGFEFEIIESRFI